MRAVGECKGYAGRGFGEDVAKFNAIFDWDLKSFHFGTQFGEEYLTIDPQRFVAIQFLVAQVVYVCGKLVMIVVCDSLKIEALDFETVVNPKGVEDTKGVWREHQGAGSTCGRIPQLVDLAGYTLAVKGNR